MEEQVNVPSSEEAMSQEIAKLKSELKPLDDQRWENEKSISLSTEKATEIAYLHQVARADRKIHKDRIVELKECIKEVPHQQSTGKELGERVEMETERNEALLSELQTVKGRLVSMTEQGSRDEVTILRLRSELDMSKREVSHLMSTRKALEGRLEKEEKTNQTLRSEVQTAKDTLALVTEQTSSDGVTLEELRSELETTKGEVKQLQSVGKELEDELEQEQKTSRTLSSELQAANHHIGLLSNQKIEDIVKIQKLRSELAKKSEVLSTNAEGAA
ncbi:hypothetical protein BKA61DRAFT_680313 [Leptodontidium sp. MPI-SDFR-AT-0119]|nr:hypothetical protein BKA61DRAFT_680313 [Leptodontidium sp. MPI-SDFR-AT-0119]